MNVSYIEIPDARCLFSSSPQDKVRFLTVDYRAGNFKFFGYLL